MCKSGVINMHMGLSEIVVIIVLAIALIKPEKLKELSATLGKTVRDIRENKDSLTEPVKEVLVETDRIKEEIDNIKEDVIKI